MDTSRYVEEMERCDMKKEKWKEKKYFRTSRRRSINLTIFNNRIFLETSNATFSTFSYLKCGL